MILVKFLALHLVLMKELIYALHMDPMMVPIISHFSVHGLKTHLNQMLEMQWVLLMDIKMAYLRSQHWESEG